MSRRHGALAMDLDAGDRDESRTIGSAAGRRRQRGRRSGAELIGIVGKNWVVLNDDPIAESSVLGRLVESALRRVREFLALG